MELLERDAQLAVLEHLFAQVRTSRTGRLALVTGEAGVGKTALVRAFADRLKDVPVLSGACEPLFTPRALAPFLDVLPGADANTTSAGPAAAALMAAVTVPSVVVLEDLHWADEATLDALSILGRRMNGFPALVIVTYREHELERDHPLRLVLGEMPDAERVVIGPFSPEAVSRLAERRGMNYAWLHERTGGNPFFVTEVLAHGGEETPSSVRDAVLTRAARLPPAARRLLEAAAVARPRAEVWLLEQIAPAELGVLEACLASGMLQAEGNAVTFRHEMARATIEDELPPDRRLALHRAVLAALVGRADEARLAHHAEAADDGPAMIEHGTRAAEQAAALGAHREAAAHYGAVLRHADVLPPAERAGLLGRRSFECFLAGMIPESLAARELALVEHRRAGDRLGEGDDERWLSRLHWYLGDGKGVRECSARAVAILAELPPSAELAMAYSNRAAPPMFDYDLAETAEWGGKALRLAEELGEQEVLIATIRNMGSVELSHGLADGAAKVQRSLDLALEAGMQDHVGVAYSNLVSSSLTIHDYDTAGAYLTTGRAFCEEHDLRSWGTYLDAWAARFALDQGRWVDASDLVDHVLERAPRSLPHSRFVALLVRGVLSARTGEGDPWPDLDEALGIARGTNELQRIGPVAVARAELAGWPGTPRGSPVRRSKPGGWPSGASTGGRWPSSRHGTTAQDWAGSTPTS